MYKISKLKNKITFGLDLISNKTLKIIAPIILKPLLHVINLFRELGYVPKELKINKVLPIYKAEEKNKFTNYCPISLLSTFSKLLERIVAAQMISFLDKSKILYSHQYGFRRGYSTTHPIIHYIELIRIALNRHEHTVAIFIDL